MISLLSLDSGLVFCLSFPDDPIQNLSLPFSRVLRISHSCRSMIRIMPVVNLSLTILPPVSRSEKKKEHVYSFTYHERQSKKKSLFFYSFLRSSSHNILIRSKPILLLFIYPPLNSPYPIYISISSFNHRIIMGFPARFFLCYLYATFSKTYGDIVMISSSTILQCF